MKITTVTAICMLLLVSVFTKGFGQTIPRADILVPQSYWGGVGVGPSSAGHAIALNANAEISDGLIFSVSLQVETNSKKQFFEFSPGRGKETDVYAFDVFAGKIYQQKFALFILSTGLGIVKVVNSSDTNTGNGASFAGNLINTRTEKYTVGVPIQVQGYLIAWQTAALGVGGYVNLNTIKTTAGITLNLAVGRMRTYK